MNVIRNFIKANPVFYPFYINFIKGNNVDFPKRSTDLHLTGFPRSANTYCRQLIMEVFPELNLVTHIHTVASLKKAQKHNVKLALLLRSPLETTSSMLIKFNNKQEGEVLYDYIKYHEFVLLNIEKIQIFRFEEVIKSPWELMYFIRSEFNIDISDERIAERLKTGDKKSRNKEKAKDPLGSSRPNNIKKNQKDAYKESIISHNLYPLAYELYLKLNK